MGGERLRIAMAIFDGAEAEALALHMEGLALCVLQHEDGGVEIRRLSRPEFGAVDGEIDMGLVAGYSHSGAGGFFLAFGVDDIDTY